MKSHRSILGIVAMCVGLLGLIPLPGRALADAPRSLRVLSAAEDSGGVLVTLDVTPVDTSTTEDWFLEFEFDPPEVEDVIRIEAWLVTTEEGPSESVPTNEPTSVWEITPADRAVGMGGYVRLYLPHPLKWMQKGSNSVVLRVISDEVPGELLRAGVESTAATPTTAE